MGDVSRHIKNWEACLIGKERSMMTQPQRIERLLDRLRPRRFYNHVPIDGWQIAYAMYRGKDEQGRGRYDWISADLKRTDPAVEDSYVVVDKPQWRPIKLDQAWGDLWVTAFLKTTFKVPREFNGKPMFMLFFVGGDGMLRVNGQDRQGVDCFHTEIWMEDLARGGAELKLEVETFQKHEVDVERFHELMVSSMCLLDKDVEELYWDMAAAFSAAREPHARPEAIQIIYHHLDRALQIVDVFEPDQQKLRASAIEARKYLRDTIYKLDAFGVSGFISAVGHSHLDIVYKWEYDEFLRKIGRTHTTQLRLMEEFPQFKFSQSQAITYIEMQKGYPEAFRQIQKAVKEGRWEILGACFSESDCYLPNGESHIRNVMLGKRYFQKEFGVTPRIAWQCDLFGVTWSLPQIYKKCGVDYFVTHKMSIWNRDNEWPYNIYWWEGIDGTRMLAHSPSSHIIQTCEGFQLQSHWENFKEKVQCGNSLYTYGWGNGGSGVMRDMIQRAIRYQNFPGVPRLKFDTAEAFFARLARRVKDRDDLPVWSNELYLETHRGQFTTQGRLKKLNRYTEILLRNAELLASLAMVFAGFRYPHQKLNEAWKELLKAQFHDGVTGTHVPKAFEQVTGFYHIAIAAGESVQKSAMEALAAKIDTSGEGVPLIVFNTQTWQRSEAMRLEAEHDVRIIDGDGRECLTQVVRRGDRREVWFEARQVPPVGYKTFRMVRSSDRRNEAPAGGLKVSAGAMENSAVRVKLDRDGQITSFYDKLNRREVIEPGMVGNELQLFEDIAGFYQAWDLYNTKRVKRFELAPADSIEVVEQGPLRVAVEVKRRIHDSALTQRIVLWKDATWVDFETTVTWNESHKLLKVAFPLNIQTFNARYDIAFGNMDRPTHRTTTWEQTKFEVMAHKWADLSDAGYGAALINDSKYGYDCERNVLRLSLLRAPKYPNPQSDLYTHQFTYRLYAHGGDWRRGGTIRNAWELNCPMLPLMTTPHGGTMAPSGSFLNVANENVILEALKKAEDSDELIVRLVEHWGQQDCVRLSISGATSYRHTNCIEENTSAPSKIRGPIEVTMRPYEIVTLKVKGLAG